MSVRAAAASMGRIMKIARTSTPLGVLRPGRPCAGAVVLALLACWLSVTTADADLGTRVSPDFTVDTRYGFTSGSNETLTPRKSGVAAAEGPSPPSHAWAALRLQ